MRLRTVAHDLGRMVRGARAWRRERRAAIRMDLGLAFLHAEDESVVRGRPARYRLAVTELGAQQRLVQVVLDFWLEGEPDPGRGQAAYLITTVETRARQRLELEVVTDLMNICQVRAGGLPVAAHLRPGAATGPGRCAVIASVRHGECEIDRVIAWQRLETA